MPAWLGHLRTDLYRILDKDEVATLLALVRHGIIVSVNVLQLRTNKAPIKNKLIFYAIEFHSLRSHEDGAGEARFISPGF